MTGSIGDILSAIPRDTDIVMFDENESNSIALDYIRVGKNIVGLFVCPTE